MSTRDWKVLSRIWIYLYKTFIICSKVSDLENTNFDWACKAQILPLSNSKQILMINAPSYLSRLNKTCYRWRKMVIPWGLSDGIQKNFQVQECNVRLMMKPHNSYWQAGHTFDNLIFDSSLHFFFRLFAQLMFKFKYICLSVNSNSEEKI